MRVLRMLNSVFRFGVLLLLIGVAVGQDLSKRPKTVLIGTVYDTNHAVVVGARVVARDVIGQDYSAVTDELGVFFLELPVGLYKVEANANGFCPKRVNNVEPVTDLVDLVLDVSTEEHRCKQESMLKNLKSERSFPRIAE